MRKKSEYRKYLINKYLKKNKKIQDSIPANPYTNHKSAPMHIAFIVDGIVEDVIHCNDRLGVLLLSDPVIVEIENLDITVNWLYNEENNTFTPPEEIDSIV